MLCMHVALIWPSMLSLLWLMLCVLRWLLTVLCLLLMGWRAPPGLAAAACVCVARGHEAQGAQGQEPTSLCASGNGGSLI